MRKNGLIPIKKIADKIVLVRGEKVMFDTDLAELYQVETKVLNQAVKRNLHRFPEDFMFQLSKKEMKNLKSQIVTSSWGGARKLPYVFTEQGIAMLSSVLNSKIAINVNIQIIRVFTQMRRALLTHKDIIFKLQQLERKMLKHDANSKKLEGDIQRIFELLKSLISQPKLPPMKKVGYKHYPEKK